MIHPQATLIMIHVLYVLKVKGTLHILILKFAKQFYEVVHDNILQLALIMKHDEVTL